MHLRVLLLAAVALFALPCQAATVFSDQFEAEPSNVHDYAGFANFDVKGHVDVIGPSNPYGIAVTSNVVDLSGQSGPGTLTSKASFLFNTGDMVRLSFDIGSAQRGSTNTFFTRVDFGSSTKLSSGGVGISGRDNVFFSNVEVPFIGIGAGFTDNYPFSTWSIFFTAGSSGSLKFSIGRTRVEEFGPLLDNVKLDITPSAVPEVSSWAMMIAGFAMAGVAMRRARTASRVSFA